VTMIEGLGGIDAIAISHPHFYTTMVEWAHAFTARIHLHAADRQWIMRNDPAIELWDGEAKTLWDGATLVRCGGHFEGGTVLHWTGGAGRRGVVFAGDILTVTTDRKWLSFMGGTWRRPKAIEATNRRLTRFFKNSKTWTSQIRRY
jgi:glyoxylase-like metal-dependent hydrolase (beta-lactamase superfamily II)